MTEIKNETQTVTVTPDPSMKLKVAKTLTKFAASYSAKGVVAAVIAMNLPAADSKKQKLQFAVGGVVLTMMVGDYVKAYVDNEFDETVDAIRTLRKEIEVTRVKDETVTDTVTDPK